MKTVCLLGLATGASLSPAMHNAAFRALGLDVRYVPFSLGEEQLPWIVQAIRSLSLLGGNVTVPYKEKVIPLLDELSPEAARCTSVNTICRREGRLFGHSTDGEGLRLALADHGIPLDGATVLILGAGGAARAVAFALAEAGIRRLVVANRTRAVGDRLVADLHRSCAEVELGSLPAEDLSAGEMAQADLVINATSLRGDEIGALIPPGGFRPGQWAYDLNYHPRETGFTRAARQGGAEGHNGLQMLLRQAEASFRLWTGVEPPHSRMAAALEAASLAS